MVDAVNLDAALEGTALILSHEMQVEYCATLHVISVNCNRFRVPPRQPGQPTSQRLRISRNLSQSWRAHTGSRGCVRQGVRGFEGGAGFGGVHKKAGSGAFAGVTKNTKTHINATVSHKSSGFLHQLEAGEAKLMGSPEKESRASLSQKAFGSRFFGPRGQGTHSALHDLLQRTKA